MPNSKSTTMSNEQSLLKELKNESSSAFESLYKDNYRMIASLITRMGGDQIDAEDIFQETLFVLVKKIREPDFVLTAKISTYMHAIARNLWLKKSKKAGMEVSMTEEDFSFTDIEQSNALEELEEKELMIGVVLDKINALEKDCKNVIRLTFIKKLSHAEVAEILGYTTSFVKVKKFRCLKYLREKVMSSPFFQAS